MLRLPLFNKRFQLLLACAGVLLLLVSAGCATMSAMDCVTADWESVGEIDGAQGQPLSYMQTRKSDCLKHAVRLDEEAYMRGRDAGLLRYCTVEGGFEAGMHGWVYHGVCTGTAQAAFSRGYVRGQDVWQAEQSYGQADQAVISARKKVDRLERAIDELEDLVDDEDATEADRKKWLDQIRENEKRLRRLRDQVQELISKRERAWHHLQNVKEAANREGFEV